MKLSPEASALLMQTAAAERWCDDLTEKAREIGCMVVQDEITCFTEEQWQQLTQWKTTR